jgi:hypothetical protein
LVEQNGIDYIFGLSGTKPLAHKRSKATSPACMEDFALSDGVLFALGTEPPAAALAVPNAIWARIEERKQRLRNEGMYRSLPNRSPDPCAPGLAS